MTDTQPAALPKLRTRKELEQIEVDTLAPYACKSQTAHSTRHFEEPQHSYRTSFQRDRDRIVHSRAFRRLKHKRQVFLTSDSDHYRTRITHTLEVAQLARTMAKVLSLNEELVEAIALGHDLGHTPFGHLGEVVLHDIMNGRHILKGQENVGVLGGFKHNYQSLRIVDKLERKYTFPGLNLTAAVREGLLKHTRLKRSQIDYPDLDYTGLAFARDPSSTIEGQVVAICDEIAQRTHDLEDGIRAGLVQLQDVRELAIIKRVENGTDFSGICQGDNVRFAGMLVRGLINLLVDDVIDVTVRNIASFIERQHRQHDFDSELVTFSAAMDPLQNELNKFIYQKIIHFSRVRWSDEMGKKLIARLFQAYVSEPGLLSAAILETELKVDAHALAHNSGHEQREVIGQLQGQPGFYRAICDYIAGMTDTFALREAERLASMHRLEINDLAIDSALGEV